VQDNDFKAIFAAENSNKFQKTKFCKEKSVEDVVTLGPMAHATLVDNETKNQKWCLGTSIQGQCSDPLHHYKHQPISNTWLFILQHHLGSF
jgi:hypothetical protein